MLQIQLHAGGKRAVPAVLYTRKDRPGSVASTGSFTHPRWGQQSSVASTGTMGVVCVCVYGGGGGGGGGARACKLQIY